MAAVPGSTASARTPPPACSQAAASWPSPERCASTREQHPRPSGPRRSPSAGSRLPAGRDQPFRHEPGRPRLRRAAAPPRGAAQSGPRAPGRAAGPAAAWPRYRPAAQPEGGSLLGTHQERRPVPGTGPAGEVRHRRPPRAARPYPVAARQLSATGRSTRAAPNCCSRSSPGGTNTPRSGSGPTFRSGEWGSVFGDQRLVAQSLTGSPSTRTSSRPAPVLPAVRQRPRRPDPARLQCHAIAMTATIALAPTRRRLAACVVAQVSPAVTHLAVNVRTSSHDLVFSLHSPSSDIGRRRNQTRPGCRTLCSAVTGRSRERTPGGFTGTGVQVILIL